MKSRSPPPVRHPRRFPWVWAVVGLLLLVVVGLLARPWDRTPDESEAPAPPAELDPPPFESPYLNTKPGVKYVGDTACVKCHATLGDHYRQHPMGRSITPVSAVASLGEHVSSGGNPFDALGVRFSTERSGAGLVHRETAREPGGRVVAETAATVEYVIGSGTHAYSYLLNRDGVLTQSPVSWFRQKGEFDLSPGFGPGTEHFERPIVPGCLFCHANHVDPEPDSVNRYRGAFFTGHAIGCERCHGPGELHAAERRAKPTAQGRDLTIVNPSALPPKLRDDVCNQCHLGAKERVVRRGKDTFDYRPGLPLEEFLRVFVLPPADSGGMRVAGHSEQMTVSQCFVKSNGAMGCTSCHDPHRAPAPAPAEKETYFRQRCLTCHETKGCTEPLTQREAKRDNCVVCHMPQSGSNVTHVALTDHRIPRRPDSAPPPASLDPVAAAKRLIPFGRDTLSTSNPELMRDLAVGLVSRARNQSEAVRQQIAFAWRPTLERAVGDHPDDLSARECYGVVLAWDGDLDAALAACEATLARSPKRELVLSDSGLIAQRLGLPDRSLGYWTRALEINPHSSRYRYEVANALAVRGDWPAAVEKCQAVLAANGGHVPSRLLLMQHHWQSGAKDKARSELVAILALHPPNEAQLRQRFTEILR